jgi:N-acetyl-gamma-glutamyl-phosphate reductase
LLRLLSGHPDFEVVAVTADSNAGAAVGDLYPALRPAYGDLVYSAVDAAELRGLDVVFCALPHGASQTLLPELVDHVAHVVDLGADFRLPPDVYARWYAEQHHAPELVSRFAYGLVELYRDALATHAHVASPGCYPTAVSLACAPLVAMGLVEPRIVADAVSGVSGAGRGLKTTSLFSEANENVSAYGLLNHRHTAEMEQALS